MRIQNSLLYIIKERITPLTENICRILSLASGRIRGALTRDIEIGNGVRQGCVLSPILFNLWSEFIMNEALSEVDGVQINGICIK